MNAIIGMGLAEDTNFLDQGEIDMINDRVDLINAHIEALAGAHENVTQVDLKTYYDQLNNGGVATTENILNRTLGQGFFSLDGYYPSYSGNADIANEFIRQINAGDIGIDMDEIDIDEAVLPVDPYNMDSDEDGFLPSPGTISELVVPVCGPDVEGWVDCNDSDAETYPENVSGEECGF